LLRHRQSIYAYLGAGLIIAIVAILCIAGLAASRQNAQSLETQQVVARYESDDAFAHVQGQLTQMIFWQAAFDNVVRRWNDKWVEYQFGPYQDAMGNHLVAIYAPGGALRFLHVGDRSSNITVASLARAEGLGALLHAARASRVDQPPPMHQGVVSVDGTPYFAVAALVTPEDEADIPLARQRPTIVVFFAPATVASFDALSDGFAATQLGIARHAAAQGGLAQTPLRSVDGKPLAWLSWKPRLAGADFLETVIPAVIVVFFLLALVQGAIVRRWQTMQRKLLIAEAMTAAAQEESRTKSVFLGTISHELRTPLNAIIGFSDVLLHRMFGPLGSPRYEEYAGYIRSSGASLLKIVNDLIEIARIDARDTAQERARIDAAGCALLAIDSAREAAAAKNVSLVLEAEGAAWCEGSPLSLTQAIGRILDNAIRHSKTGDRVSVAARRDGADTLVEVRDSGDGISAERLAGLGRPFGHTESHLVTGNGGAGLGLSIAKGLMRLMGGSLGIASEVGVGTIVTLRLPAAEAPQQAVKKAA